MLKPAVPSCHRALKTIIALLASAIGSASFAGGKVPEILFHRAPEDLTPAIQAPYDPILASVMASLISRQPERKDDEWELLMAERAENRNGEAGELFFSAPIPVRFRNGAGPNSPTFLIIPGSFATWKRGSFMNKTVHALDLAIRC